MNPPRFQCGCMRRIASRAILIVLGLCCLSLPCLSVATDTAELIRRLTSLECEGRRAGEPGGERAVSILQEELESLGLAELPGFPGLRQEVRFRVPAGEVSARLALDGAEQPQSEWTPLAISAGGTAKASALFCGYGIDAPELGWTDYQGTDVAGRVVVFLRQVPSGLHAPGDEWQRATELMQRLETARDQGAAAVLVADSPFEESSEALRGSGPDAALNDAGLPVAGISAVLADQLLAPTGQTLRGLVSRLNRARTAQASLVMSGLVELSVTRPMQECTTWNLGAAIPGKGAAASRWILLCAHHDHLGRGADGMGPVHPGADDNASGAAMVLGLAADLAAKLASAQDERRSLAVVLFGGEELGRLGSRHLVDARPPWLDSLDLVLNLDMVGRIRDVTLLVLGGDAHPELMPLVKASSTDAGLKARACPEAPGGDHESFLAAGIPAVMLFTGSHEDYHRSTDTFEKLDLESLPAIRRALGNCVPGLLDPALKPARPQIAPGRSEVTGEPVKVAIGIIPGYESSGAGMPVQDVRAGTAAALSGVRPGDLIIALGRFPVTNIHDYTFALRHFAAGDEVSVALLREGRRLQMTVKLEERRK